MTLTHLSSVTVVVDVPDDAAENELREAVLRECDSGRAEFDAVLWGLYDHATGPDGSCELADPDEHWLRAGG